MIRRQFDISSASSSPPRPSKSSDAFAEQSTKNSILPSLGLFGSGVSISGLIPTMMSELARQKRDDPLALAMTFVSSSIGLKSLLALPSFLRLS